jgi:hypothetical protein
VELPGGGSTSKGVRPEDKMAADSQNGDIITLSLRISVDIGYISTMVKDGLWEVHTFPKDGD